VIVSIGSERFTVATYFLILLAVPHVRHWLEDLYGVQERDRERGRERERFAQRTRDWRRRSAPDSPSHSGLSLPLSLPLLYRARSLFLSPSIL
jgi:hypothetical protein